MTHREYLVIVELMPVRREPLVNGEFYHILNRGVASGRFFKNAYDYRRFVDIFNYYQFDSPSLKFSHFKTLSPKAREKHFKGTHLVNIVAYCLMPNHYHFLLRQEKDEGIMEFTKRLGDSYAKYFNNKHKRKGPLFEGRFKAIRIESEPQLLHLSRYIHLNPYSASLVRDIGGLIEYPYSSLREYLELGGKNICRKKVIMTAFNNRIEKYKNFITDQADYQKNLQIIKDQLLE